MTYMLTENELLFLHTLTFAGGLLIGILIARTSK